MLLRDAVVVVIDVYWVVLAGLSYSEMATAVLGRRVCIGELLDVLSLVRVVYCPCDARHSVRVLRGVVSVVSV